MNISSLPTHLPGPFTFLDPIPGELAKIRAIQADAMPRVRKIFLEDENATPLVGFPVLVSSRLMALEKALEQYLLLEERAQMAIARKQSFDSRAYNDAWDSYAKLLASATEFTILSSYGRAYPNVFWLRHSRAVARCLAGTLGRLEEIDSGLALEQGHRIRYAAFFHYLDRVLSLTYRKVRALTKQVEEAEADLFPGLLTVMRDNVLIFTERQVGRDLEELTGYLQGHLGIDERDFRDRLAKLRAWHEVEFAAGRSMRDTVRDLLGPELAEDPGRLLHRSGYIRYLSRLPSYDARHLLTRPQVDLWEQLLPTLKEYELLRSFQRLVLPAGREGTRLAARDPRTRGTGLPPRRVYLSVTTRPLDFMTPWVLDPEVGRLGLIYDIRQFSESLSEMERTSLVEQERTFQMIFRFQRRINQLAFSRRLRLEKYLGDGALYSGINRPHHLLVVAVLIQRHYRDAVEAGFPFNRGLRIALNFGQYRMLPIQSSQPGEAERYEFFGHGIVELTRLITGKTMHETEEMKKLLVNLGYPQSNVDAFFAPLERRNLDVVDRSEEDRRFRAYINPNATLINEGIVATRGFIEELDREGSIESMELAGEGGRRYVVVSVRDGVDVIRAGVRKLGKAEFKGIGSLIVYEVVSGHRWEGVELLSCPEQTLLSATAAQYTGRKPVTYV
jgi:hypothetical protein